MSWAASVATPIAPVGELRLEDGRHHRRGHVLEALDAVQGLVGLHGHAQGARAHPAQMARDADEGAAGAQAGDEQIERAPGELLDDLRAGGQLVGPRVGGVGVLVDVGEVVGMGGGQLARLGAGAVRALQRVGLDDLDSVGAQDALALDAGVGGQAQGDPEAEGRAEHRVGDARVPAGRVEQPPLGQEAAAEGVEHDAPRGAVLDAAPGLADSSLASTVRPCGGMRRSWTSGVRPMRSSTGMLDHRFNARCRQPLRDACHENEPPISLKNEKAHRRRRWASSACRASLS